MALLVGASPAGAGATSPVAFHLTFRVIARGAQSGLFSSGPYLDASDRYVGFNVTTSFRPVTIERFLVLDDLTGKRIMTPPGCVAPILGRIWVLCAPSDAPWELYNLRTRKTRHLPSGCYGPTFLRTSQVVCYGSPEAYELYNARTRKLRRLPCDGLCQQDYGVQRVVAVGSRWFEVEVGPCGDQPCGQPPYAYYNTRTGQQHVPVVTASEGIDLNSPTLTHPLCGPLLEPPGYSPTTFGSTLTFDGTFAIAQEPDGIYAERCGSDLKLPLAEPPDYGTLIVVPRAAAVCSSETEGYFLPSLQPFTIDALPFIIGARPACPLLAPRHAYAIDAQGHLWAAPLPRQLQDLTSTQPRRHTKS